MKKEIDYWVIVDTGSKDGTQEIIREFMSDIPGELHERPWVNFAHNRNEALKLAKGKGDYVLFIDADEELEGTLDKKSLNQDTYIATLRNSKIPLVTSQRFFLIKDNLDFSWKGVVHEWLECDQNPQMEVLPDLMISVEAKDGARSRDPQKNLKDAQILEKALVDDPNNSNYVYYLAQSYFCADELPLALKYYQKRAQMEGWEQHTFWAKYCVGRMQELLKMDSDQIIRSYLEAYRFRPTRIEPICSLALYFHGQKHYLLGYLLAQFCLTIPQPDDHSYIEDWMYSYGVLAVLANCALELGRDKEAIALYEKLIKNPATPKQMCEEADRSIKYLKGKEG